MEGERAKFGGCKTIDQPSRIVPGSSWRDSFFALFEKSSFSAACLAPEGRISPETAPSIARSTLRNEARAVETEIKFAGYLEQQKKSIERLKAAESVTIPNWLQYSAISGLSREMRETFERIRPMTIGQASRLPGVTPAALTLVHVSIKLQGKLQAKPQDAEHKATA